MHWVMACLVLQQEQWFARQLQAPDVQEFAQKNAVL
jgi:hypothetical protein